MDIIGNGVDIIKNSRINKSLKIKGFLNRIFTKNEIKQGKKLKNKIISFLVWYGNESCCCVNFVSRCKGF